MSVALLTAADGLCLCSEGDDLGRVAWREADWLGPLGLQVRHRGVRYLASAIAEPDARAVRARRRTTSGVDDIGTYSGVELDWDALPFSLRTSVRAYERHPILVFRIESPTGASGLAGPQFEEPSIAWPLFSPHARAAGGVPAETRTFGYQYTEFALPVFGDADLGGFLLAGHRPAVVEPLLFVAPDGRTLLIAPLDQFHEQIIAVPRAPAERGSGLRCGWHGDLAEVPAGFASELAVWAGASPRAVLESWGELLQRCSGIERPSRYSDDGVGKLSYWTDNGAVYYYRTEQGCDYTTTLERVIARLESDRVPVTAVQLDSWFYPHRHSREVSSEGAPMVPPSGMLRWEPRDDLFPNGFESLRERLGGRPLIFHSRHFASDSPYFERCEAWRDGDYAHPSDPALFDEMLENARRWGAITYEQDWMVETFLGVRGLREVPGRARAWQEYLDRAAAKRGLSLQWCMASPADFLQTVTLPRVASIRSSGDYRYLFDNGFNWTWFLHTNALARALGLNPFKDVFLSHSDDAEAGVEPYAEVEALLAALSAGPVGIGDRVGRTDRELVLRTCRTDGVLVKPDLPLAAVDRCFRASSFATPSLLVGLTHSKHDACRWTYVVTLHACTQREPLRGRVELGDLGAERPSGPVLCYDWRRGHWQRLPPDGGWDVELDFQGWDYRVLCPELPGGRALLGDPTKYATAGDRRIGAIEARRDAIELDVLGAADEAITVRGYAESAPHFVEVLGHRSEGAELTWDAAFQTWTVSFSAAPGSCRVQILWKDRSDPRPRETGEG